MQEIIEGYPFVECHKNLVVNESIEFEKKGIESPAGRRKLTELSLNSRSPSRPASMEKRSRFNQSPESNAFVKAKVLQLPHEKKSELDKCYISSRIVNQLESFQDQQIQLEYLSRNINNTYDNARSNSMQNFFSKKPSSFYTQK